jgi:hypothetical protein
MEEFHTLYTAYQTDVPYASVAYVLSVAGLKLDNPGVQVSGGSVLSWNEIVLSGEAQYMLMKKQELHRHLIN